MEEKQFFSKISGVTFQNPDGSSRQDLISRYCRPGMKLSFILEPDNPVTKDAVGVWALASDQSFGRVQIGYLNPEVADEVRAHLYKGGQAHAIITEITGGTKDKPTLGVNIDLRFTDPAKAAVSTAQASSVKPKDGARWKITAGGLVLALVAFCCGAFGIGMIFTIGEDITTPPQTADAQQPVTQIAVTQVAVTQVEVTQIIAGPTYTPLPTYTNPAPPPPEIIFVTPTMPPDWTLIQSFSGQGKYTTDFFRLDTGKVRIKWNFVGSGNFAFHIRRLDNDSGELLENAIGSVNGQKIMNVGASDQYVIDVEYGDGSWEITIEFMP